MTRKDYVLIAKAIKESQPAMLPAGLLLLSARRAQHARTATCVMEALASDNPRFDRSKFEEACGLYACNQGEVPG